MKVRLETLDLDKRCRRAVSYHFGREGLASAEEIRRAIDDLITGWISDLTTELDSEEDEP